MVSRDFHRQLSIVEKVDLLLPTPRRLLEESGFMKGCPVAAVALDLDRDSEGCAPCAMRSSRHGKTSSRQD